jgi:PGF-CTERM protein
MRRSLVPVLALLVALAGVTAIPVAAHGNHLSADAQVVDGHVVAERAFLLVDGYAVVHIDQGGSMGRAIGHKQLDAGPHSNLEIPVDEEFLSQIDGSATVWVTLHRSNGDGEFDPADDTPLIGIQGSAAGTTIPIQVADSGSVNVVARDFGEQRIDESAVEISRVELDDSGHLAVSNGDGDVVGSTALDAGVHENVTVDLDRSYYDSLAVNETTTLTASVYRDDDDGFDASADDPVTIAGTPVATEFTIQKVENASRTTSIVITAAETKEPNTVAPTSAEPASSTAASTTASPNSGPVPGFGVGATVLALLASLALVRRW